MALYNIRQEIKKDSYQWYSKLRAGEYEYIHEYKERIDEILSLQQKHHEIIKSNEHNPQIQQTSLAELHKLNITLSNLYDVAPTIINDITLSPHQRLRHSQQNQNQLSLSNYSIDILKDIIINLVKIFLGVLTNY